MLAGGRMKLLHVVVFCCFSASFSTSTQIEPLPPRSISSSPELSSPAPTLPSTGQRNQRDAGSLSDTSVVIIVSVSLALLVCAIIPVMFYGHWRSNAGDQNRPEANKAEDSSAVRLQSVESRDEDPSQYTNVYQALDPKTLD